MKIDARSLTKCSVEDDGETISLGLVDDNGQAVELKVSASDASAMAMTLPRLLKNAIQEKHKDDSLRYVFPLDNWQIEAASDGKQVIVTLMTGSGFEVSFVTKPDTCRSIGIALSDSLESGVKHVAPMAN